VGEEELSRVKNYLLGEFLRSADGAFALSDIFASISAYGLDYDYYDRYLKTINEITAEEIQIVAQKYLHEDSLIFVAAGNIESEKRK
jgi:predicted Zn-dependent peptidase